MSADLPSDSNSITIQLVDPSDGRQIQAWRFDDVLSVTIGRGEDQLVSLADPYVSRHHAELRREATGWRVYARGRNGVFIDGANISDKVLADDEIFRLGSNGPALRYRHTKQAATGSSTLSFDPEAMLVLQMDRSRLMEDTSVVVETEYFQKLKGRVSEIRKRRPPAPG